MANKLLELRKSLGLTLKEFSAELGIHTTPHDKKGDIGLQLLYHAGGHDARAK